MDLWAGIPARASGVDAAATGLALLHLDQAIYCRKWDLWCNQQAQAVAQARMAMVLWPSNSQRKKATPMVQFPLVRALKQGLSLAAIAGVADDIITAIQGCDLGDPVAAKAAAAAAARTAINVAAADSTSLRPSADDFLDPILVSPPPPSVWASFEASLDPNDGHVQQVHRYVTRIDVCNDMHSDIAFVYFIHGNVHMVCNNS